MSTISVVTVGGVGNLHATNGLAIDMVEKRRKSYGALTPLTKMLSIRAANPAISYKIECTQENVLPTTVEVATTESAAGTTVVLKNYGTSLVIDQLLYHPDLDDMRRVTAVPTTDSVTVAISQAGTTSAAWAAGDQIRVLPPALAENDETYRPISAVDTHEYNFMQLCKVHTAITRMNDAQSTVFGGPGEKRKRLHETGYYHFRVMKELLKVMGSRSESGTAPATLRMSGGLQFFLRGGTLFKNFNGTFTESGFDNWLGDFHDQNPDISTITYFGAPNCLRQINYWVKDRIRLSPNAKEYGININRYIGGPLAVDLVEMPLLNDKATKGWGFLLNLDNMDLKDLQGQGDALILDAKGNAAAGEIIYDCWRSVTSMLISNENRHAMHVGAIN